MRSLFKGHRLLLGGIVLLAVGLRISFFLAVLDSNFAQVQVEFKSADTHTFYQWASAILDGDILGRDTFHPYFDWMKGIGAQEDWYRWWGGKEIFHQAPLYPYLLAGLLWTVGGSVHGVMLAQLLIGALGTVVVYGLGRKLFNQWTGLIAALLVGVYGPLIFYEATLLRDWLVPLLYALMLLILIHARDSGLRRWWFISGAVAGLAYLTKPTILVVGVLLLGWLIWEYRNNRPKLKVALAMLLLGLVLTLMPLMVRNKLVGAPILSLTTRTAEGIIMGNAADSHPVSVSVPTSMRSILTKSEGHTGAVVREVIATYEGDWSAMIAKQFYKLRGLLDPFEVPNNYSLHYGGDLWPMLNYLPGYGLLLPLGIAGLLVTLRQWRTHLPLLCLAVGLLITLLLPGIVARFRLVLVAVLCVYGAAGLLQFGYLLKQKRYDLAAGAATCLIVVAVVVHVFVPIAWLRQETFFVVHPKPYQLTARLYEQDKQFGRAGDQYMLMRLHLERLAQPSLRDRDKLIERELTYRLRAARHHLGQSPPAPARAAQQANLAESLLQLKRTDAIVHYELGVLWSRLENIEQARRHLQTYLKLAPHSFEAQTARTLLDLLE